MKHFLPIILISMLMLCGCKDDTTLTEEAFVSCDTIDDGIELSGIPIDVSDAFGDFSLNSVMVNGEDFIQLSYLANECELFIRKGHFDIDKLCDTKEPALKVDGKDIYLIRSKDTVTRAVWRTDDYSYFLNTSIGLTEDSIVRLIMQIN